MKKEDAKNARQAESKGVFVAASTNSCISCGREIPEGMLVCMECEKGLSRPRCVCCHTPVQNGQSVCVRCSKLLLHKK